VKPSPLLHRRLGSLSGALSALAEAEGEGKVLAGGQSLVPLLNLRLAAPQVLVDVQDVPGGGRVGEPLPVHRLRGADPRLRGRGRRT
jgi:2-furoyl-CoA dehydrogenase FAD binding subunit